MVPLLVFLQLAAAYPVGVGEPAPDRALLGLDGKPVRLREQAPAVVSFFATWCEPCHRALADLLTIHRQRPGFSLVLVAVGEPAWRVRRFLADQAVPSDVVVSLDETAAAARAWGQDRFPTAFMVDRRGIIRHINRGYGRGFRARIERWLPDIRGGD